MSEAVLRARFFDGKTAAGHDVDAAFAPDGVTIRGAGADLFWPAKRLRVAARDDREIRLSNVREGEARLIIDAREASVIESVLPDLLSGEPERRRMTALVAALIAGAAVVAAGVFWGAPAASGPLAERTPKDLEIQMGENVAGQVNLFLKPCGADADIVRLNDAISAMAAKGDVGFPITFQIVNEWTPNAFALPGGQVMTTRGLIEATAEDQEAFFAVMAHELGHVKARDSLKAIYRNAGAGVVLDIVTGGSGAAQQAVIIAGQLNQLRHTRKQEAAADEAAYDIMLASNLDPAALARAFDLILGALPDDDNDDDEMPLWASSHPDTRKRIENAKARAAPGGPPPFAADDWKKLADACAAS
jgi:predicted Zn-dependent protease